MTAQVSIKQNALHAMAQMQPESPPPRFQALVSDEVKKVTDEGLAKSIAETAKHPGPVKSLDPDQAKAIVTYIRSLQK